MGAGAMVRNLGQSVKVLGLLPHFRKLCVLQREFMGLFGLSMKGALDVICTQ
jgi:hypothetical protein